MCVLRGTSDRHGHGFPNPIRGYGALCVHGSTPNSRFHHGRGSVPESCASSGGVEYLRRALRSRHRRFSAPLVLLLAPVSAPVPSLASDPYAPSSWRRNSFSSLSLST